MRSAARNSQSTVREDRAGRRVRIAFAAARRQPYQCWFQHFVPGPNRQYFLRLTRENSPSAERLTRIVCSAAQTASTPNLYLLKNRRNSTTSQAGTASNHISGWLESFAFQPRLVFN